MDQILGDLEDINKLEYWFGEVLDEYYETSELVDLLMMAIGERRNGLFVLYTKEFEDVMKEFCDFYDLKYRIQHERSLKAILHRFYVKLKGEDDYGVKSIWVSRNRVPKIPLFYDSEDIGKFLNYPDSAVDAFLDEEKMGDEKSDYVSFRPAKNEISSLIEEERRRIKGLKELEKRGLDFPSKWLEEFESYSNASS